jgi:hypothetical protein
MLLFWNRPTLTHAHFHVSILFGLDTFELSNQARPTFNGTIPTELGDMSSLQTLTLHWVNVSGPLPTELGQLDNLTYLELSWTLLTGALPNEWSSLTNLKTLALYHSEEISGTIPSDYGLLTSLETINIISTNLSGTVGPEICALDFTDFVADCSGEEPRIKCDCCTECRKALRF